MGFDFSDAAVQRHMLDGNFGLEKESLRVTGDGFLSHTGHPFPDDPNMDRDFCENQTELITDVWDSVEGAWEQMAQLHTKAVRTLHELESGAEVLWPFSNPPYVKGEHDIPIATFRGSLHGKEKYREYLAQKYGKKKMLYSGIHFNFSFSEQLLDAGCPPNMAFRTYKDKIYLELAKKVTSYSWLIVYLTAASSVMDGSFLRDEDLGRDIHPNFASARCSEIGYWNEFLPLLEYGDLQTYVRSISAYVDAGQLRAASELYYPVRLKPRGENSLENLQETGIDHIEIRTLDLNPLSPIGVRVEDLQFIHLLMLYLMSWGDSDFAQVEQTMAIKNVKRAAQYNDAAIKIETGWNTVCGVREAALSVLDDMCRFYDGLSRSDLTQVIEKQKDKILQPDGRYAAQVRKRFGRDFVKNGVSLAEAYLTQLVRQS